MQRQPKKYLPAIGVLSTTDFFLFKLNSERNN